MGNNASVLPRVSRAKEDSYWLRYALRDRISVVIHNSHDGRKLQTFIVDNTPVSHPYSRVFALAMPVNADVNNSRPRCSEFRTSGIDVTTEIYAEDTDGSYKIWTGKTFESLPSVTVSFGCTNCMNPCVVTIPKGEFTVDHSCTSCTKTGIMKVYAPSNPTKENWDKEAVSLAESSPWLSNVNVLHMSSGLWIRGDIDTSYQGPTDGLINMRPKYVVHRQGYAVTTIIPFMSLDTTAFSMFPLFNGQISCIIGGPCHNRRKAMSTRFEKFGLSLRSVPKDVNGELLVFYPTLVDSQE